MSNPDDHEYQPVEPRADGRVAGPVYEYQLDEPAAPVEFGAGAGLHAKPVYADVGESASASVRRAREQPNESAI